MSEGNSKKSEAQGVSDFGFEWKYYLIWLSGGDLEDGTERVSEIGFEVE